MYEYIKGKYIGINKEYIVVENNNVAYKIYTSGSTMSQMPNKNEEVKLYIEQIVRDDFIGLYGFLTEDERAMFNLLLTINGVGAKAALSLLSISNVNNLKVSIVSSEYNMLIKAPGIGKKIAQRIILELKDKIDVQDEEIMSDDLVNMSQVVGKNLEEALQALISLGFSEKEAKASLKLINKDDSLEEIIKQSLKHLMN